MARFGPSGNHDERGRCSFTPTPPHAIRRRSTRPHRCSRPRRPTRCAITRPWSHSTFSSTSLTMSRPSGGGSARPTRRTDRHLRAGVPVRVRKVRSAHRPLSPLHDRYDHAFVRGGRDRTAVRPLCERTRPARLVRRSPGPRVDSERRFPPPLVDRGAIPLVRAAEARWSPPFGQSVLAIGRSPGAP